MKIQRPTRGPRRGFTLTEIVLSMTVLLVAVGGTFGTLGAYVRLDEQTAQRGTALRAAQERMERLQAEPFGDLFERYNDEVSDDPGVGLPSPGANFAVAGLDVQAGDTDGFVGRIIFPVDPAAPGAIREDVVDLDLGMPADLNLDGLIDALDHTADHVLLPVRVEIAWTGPAGMQSVTLDSSISPR